MGVRKIFFPSLNMYQAKSGVKNFSLYFGGGGGVPCENFFSSLNMYHAKSGVKKNSLCKKYFYKTTSIHTYMQTP